MPQPRTPCVVNIISGVTKSLPFEWVAEGLQQHPFRLVFILLNEAADTPLEAFLRSRGIPVHFVRYAGKSSLFPALMEVQRLLRREKATIVHCHLFDACIVGLSAALAAGVRHRIHTRHNSTLHHIYFPRAVWYDRLINRLSTRIVSISPKVTEVLRDMEGVPEKKIVLIPHGFDFTAFRQVNESAVAGLRAKWNYGFARPVIGVVSRFIHWKGVQHIIPAFRRFRDAHPNALLVLANASGPYAGELRKMLQAQLPAESWREIPFETEVLALFRTFDAFVHVPVDDHSEAFGQVYIEALASGVPSVITRSGIALQFARHRENALVVDYRSEDGIYEALIELFENAELREHLKEEGQRTAHEYDIESTVSQLALLYQQP